jgi:hypothetical protein
MLIHLSKPGGEREGPYSLEQINEHLAAGKYRGSDYWAWYEGLPEWVPLYSVSGVVEVPPRADLQMPASTDEREKRSTPETSSTSSPVQEPLVAAADAEVDAAKLSSGMPFSALDHIFILASGQGQTASRSPVTVRMLEQTVGQKIATIREKVPRDVIANCNILEGMQGQHSIPAAVWRAMAGLKPELLRQARDGLYRISIRTYRVENEDLVSAFLFYNKEKL